MTLSEAKTIFTPELLQQISRIDINGNYGDMVMNPESYDIIEYFTSINKHIRIDISTNGSGRSLEFWRQLGQLSSQYYIKVYFCLDGLEDTHHLYRQNTSWQRIIKNASEYIAAGGMAFWKFIYFAHNRHQLEDCRKLSQKLGFRGFECIDDGRNTGPVLDTNGKQVHILGRSHGLDTTKPIEQLITESRQGRKKNFQMMTMEKPNSNKPRCETKQGTIYVTSTGDVYPCCYLGFHPRTFGDTMMPGRNQQVKNILGAANISALNQDISSAIQWFKKVEESWDIESYELGRLHVCDMHCGVK
jgi:MoaA/NifB/PqqE/SkfB family radical SAM enzyme